MIETNENLDDLSPQARELLDLLEEIPDSHREIIIKIIQDFIDVKSGVSPDG